MTATRTRRSRPTPARSSRPRPSSKETPLVPVTRFRPIVERWLLEFESPEDAYNALATHSPIQADTWRFRLSDGWKRSARSTNRGWFTYTELDLDDVDEFLSAAGLTHLWHTDLAGLLPEGRMTDEEFDETCALCGCWIDWTRGDSGVRVEVRRYRRWRLWWSVCSLCLAEQFPTPAPKPDATGKLNSKIPHEEELHLYRVYLREEVGTELLARRIYERYGFASYRSCARSLEHAWRRNGWPMRDRSTSKRLNGKRRQLGVPARIGEENLRKMYLLHRRKYVSIWRLARVNYERYGYRDPKAMSSEISRGWKALGLQAHDRIEMTRRASTKDGLSPRNWSERKRLRREAGRTLKGKAFRPQCAGTKSNGKRCEHRAIPDSVYCYAHDGGHAEERAAHLERLHREHPIHDASKLEPYEPIRLALRACFESCGSWEPLAAASGIDRRYLSHLGGDRKRQRIDKEKAATLRAAIAQVTAATVTDLEVAA